MIFYNYSDLELVIINNTMSEFCHVLWNIDYQILFFQEEQFLENILDKVSIVLNNRRAFRYLSLDKKMQSHNFDKNQIKMIVKILQKIVGYMHYISDSSKTNIASSEFKLTQKKLDELLSEMIIGDLSDDEVVLMNHYLNEFFQELRYISSKTNDQDFLENILCDMQTILENQKYVNAWGANSLISRLSLDQEQINVLIKALKILPRYFQDWDIDTRIGGSFLEIDALITKIECEEFSIKFNTVSDHHLNVIYNIINEFVYESAVINYQDSFSCDKQFLESMLSKIILIMDNRVFFKKWGDFNPQDSCSLDFNEIEIVIKMLEQLSMKNDLDLLVRVDCSVDEIKAIKDKLEDLLKKENI